MKKSDILPISRVPSSIRLSPLPPTPQPPSAGTPSSSVPIKSIEDEKFDNLSIVKTVESFETQLSLLSQKVTSFDTSGVEDVINAMIETNDKLSKEIETLENHQNLKKSIDLVEIEKQSLDTRSKSILRTLISYRSQLKELPSLPTNGVLEDTKQINIDDVLKYGMKLSKFTKIPPGNIGAHPNNFIWPAEDSLRRGMLAIASIRGEEIIKKELGLDSLSNDNDIPDINDESIKPEQPKEQEKMIVDKDESSKVTSKQEIKPSMTTSKKKDEPALDLDLFDPEIDSD